MQRSVYLQGELGERFGTKFIVHTDNYSDIFKCINANRPGFLPFLRDCHDKDIGFMLETAEHSIDHEDLLLPIKEGDITFAIAPAGSKSGMGKILAAIAIIAVIYFTGGFAGLGVGTTTASSAGWAVAAGGGLSFAGSMGVMFAINLAMAGLQQLMAPDPAVDSDSPTNYLFTGGASNTIEGDPIPVLYGELRIPGRAISVDILNGTYITNNTIPDSFNNLNQTGTTETYTA